MEIKHEQVVLVDGVGNAIGVTAKSDVHHALTPLHLAFSCYAFNTDGQLLLTQRSLTKQTWPGAWTNSCCGHPIPDEDPFTAIHRRFMDELGVDVLNIKPVLPEFRYFARMNANMVENEICPVFIARVITEPVPVRSEVENTEWVEWSQFVTDVKTNKRKVSPWCEKQIVQLTELGDEPLLWPAASNSRLPPAMRPTL